MNKVPTTYHLSNQQLIKYPMITEKATIILENNQNTFLVERSSEKTANKSSLEELFKVKVTKVNTCHLPRKQKRIGKYLCWKPQYKKAILTLSEGDVINLFTEN